LGNVIFGTKFDLIEKMLNEMDIEYTNLTELKNKHRYFQSYYFEIPQEKISNVFNSKNWEQGLIVREFRWISYLYTINHFNRPIPDKFVYKTLDLFNILFIQYYKARDVPEFT
jgi:hypothetical protein